MPKILRSVISFLVVISAVSPAFCRSVRAPDDPQNDWTPPAWERKSESSDRSWASIRQSRIDLSNPVTLYDLGDIALRQSPVLRDAWEAARAAQARKTQADSAWMPTVTLGSDLGSTKTDNNRKALSDNHAFGDISSSVEWLVFDLGGRSASIQKALQELIAANFSFNQTIQDLLRDVGKAYYTLYSAQATLVAAKADVDNARTSLYAARKKLKAGIVTKLDVLQAETNYYDSVYALDDAKGGIKSAKGDLARTVGLPADTPYRITVPYKDLRSKLAAESVTDLIERAVSARPDVSVQRAKVRAADEAVRKAESDLWPSVSYSASASHGYYRYRHNPGVDWGDAYVFVPVQIAATWTVFDGFDRWGMLVEAKAAARQEREVLKQAELTASADVWSKYYAYKTSVKKLDASEAFYTSAKASYDLALQGYDAGLKDILDLLRAQSDLSSARSKTVLSRRDVFYALVDLAHATGVMTVERGRYASMQVQKR